ncbi:hypothetical protein [Streptomyces sp. NBC_01794]|uniref:hypothetical protein n=1 Tax=Streptomyces sp. NBC_01794 TaxID=2975942 RepID=UPI00309260A9|nr:hypothetical protein OIE54_12160 [Streptomyces sp. NBC_01794]
MTAVQPPLFLPGWEQDEPQPRRVDFAALLDKAHVDYAAQRQRWVDAVRPDAWVCGRPAFNVAVSIDDWPGGEP